METEIQTIAQKIKKLKKNFSLSCLTEEKKKNCLFEISEILLQEQKYILEENKRDILLAKEQKISQALTDRLVLNKDRIRSIALSVQKVASLPEILAQESVWKTTSGLKIKKLRVPIGTLLVIYEARPNVTVDSLALGIKTGNSIVLRGSRQTKFTNEAFKKICQKILSKYKISENFLFLNNLSSLRTKELLKLEELDLIIPRGGEQLKSLVKENAKAQILGAGGGVCHLYVAQGANLEKASKIIHNAKTQRPSVCNALESVLIDKKYLNVVSLAEIFVKVFEEKNLKIFTEDQIIDLIKKNPSSQIPLECFYKIEESQYSWNSEYLDLSFSLKVVDSIEEAIEHINFFGTGHSDCIITESYQEAEIFTKFVDSGCVYVNTSTRFTDGEVFGFGAEIGISTQKLQARGPISAKELTTYKYIIESEGAIRK